MIYDGLLSRTRLRSHLAEQTELEAWLASQVRSPTYPQAPPHDAVLSEMTLVPTNSHYRVFHICLLSTENDHRPTLLTITLLFWTAARPRKTRPVPLPMSRTPAPNLRLDLSEGQRIPQTSPC
jgi:hypothetical protein